MAASVDGASSHSRYGDAAAAEAAALLPASDAFDNASSSLKICMFLVSSSACNDRTRSSSEASAWVWSAALVRAASRSAASCASRSRPSASSLCRLSISSRALATSSSRYTF
ncbi:uncharacterized protein AMSG_11608 [Thecamonas trahens ATCC 50062]|uniref:Uncharacterized protein n=1 Tax=Thecamonas trahens ATCC 50062 TaxID=461836 RepID=A0A0L0DDX0_THETB|nr:hypothetical protein AMSG_11608 [Thecamonas trahens ATCC 50062]KNC50494.1 hypothetical protein AMSG_11608 [Thecamonas trahens ATCC 50062]|eukprot:XP_013762587.1 hypothetical protein AMSG_11608 [Thecamonas trahens ATCC 50062]